MRRRRRRRGSGDEDIVGKAGEGAASIGCLLPGSLSHNPARATRCRTPGSRPPPLVPIHHPRWLNSGRGADRWSRPSDVGSSGCPAEGRSVAAGAPRRHARRAARAHRGRARGRPVPRAARRRGEQRLRPRPRDRARGDRAQRRQRHLAGVGHRGLARCTPSSSAWATSGPRDDGYYSRNGSFVNGQRLRRHRLADGDLLRVGRTQIAFRVPDPSVSSPTAVAGSRAELPTLSATQRSVLAALCRPYKDTELATPATNQQIADELVPLRRRRQGAPAHALRLLRGRAAPAEPEALVPRNAGAAGRRRLRRDL